MVYNVCSSSSYQICISRLDNFQPQGTTMRKHVARFYPFQLRCKINGHVRLSTCVNNKVLGFNRQLVSMPVIDTIYGLQGGMVSNMHIHMYVCIVMLCPEGSTVLSCSVIVMVWLVSHFRFYWDVSRQNTAILQIVLHECMKSILTCQKSYIFSQI